MFSVKQLPSADEAAAFVRGLRESIVINQQKAANGDNYAHPSDLTKSNDEKSGVLAYTQGELSNVIWADGNRVDYVFGSETYQVEQVAAALRGQPTLEGISLYGLIKDLPFQVRHWLGVIIPAIFAGVALCVMLGTVIIGQGKKPVILPAVS